MGSYVRRFQSWLCFFLLLPMLSRLAVIGVEKTVHDRSIKFMFAHFPAFACCIGLEIPFDHQSSKAFNACTKAILLY